MQYKHPDFKKCYETILVFVTKKKWLILDSTYKSCADDLENGVIWRMWGIVAREGSAKVTILLRELLHCIKVLTSVPATLVKRTL